MQVWPTGSVADRTRSQSACRRCRSSSICSSVRKCFTPPIDAVCSLILAVARCFDISAIRTIDLEEILLLRFLSARNWLIPSVQPSVRGRCPSWIVSTESVESWLEVKSTLSGDNWCNHRFDRELNFLPTCADWIVNMPMPLLAEKEKKTVDLNSWDWSLGWHFLRLPVCNSSLFSLAGEMYGLPAS